jgi:hypothetical protein
LLQETALTYRTQFRLQPDIARRVVYSCASRLLHKLDYRRTLWTSAESSTNLGQNEPVWIRLFLLLKVQIQRDGAVELLAPNLQQSSAAAGT